MSWSQPTIFTDGSSLRNPGHGGSGFYVRGADDRVCGFGRYLGDSVTNNEAEYEALHDALKWAIKAKSRHVNIVCDSLLVVKQMRRQWRAKEPRMAALRDRALVLARDFDSVTYRHVLRKFNGVADALAQRAATSRKPELLTDSDKRKYKEYRREEASLPIKKRRKQ